MTLPNIALVGANGAGKDTVARWLYEEYAYERLAFADPLRALAELNPHYLESVIAHGGYEPAKREDPEVRDYLVALGEGIRVFDPDYFVRAMARRYDPSVLAPSVLTDVRNQREMDWAESHGFRPVVILREGSMGFPSLTVQHAPLYINNSGGLRKLKNQLQNMISIADWSTGSGESRGLSEPGERE